MVTSCQIVRVSKQAKNRLLAYPLFLTFLLVSAALLQAQTFTVLHSFTNGNDGGSPHAGVTLDRGGNFYGTTLNGGPVGGCSGFGCGVVYKLQHRGSGWTLAILHTFVDSSTEGGEANTRVVFGPDGALYGTTLSGGFFNNGTVYKLQPPLNICPTVSCPWTETVLHMFSNDPDGAYPAGDVVFDSTGNLYGATNTGGNSGFTCANDRPCGAVYKLARVQGGWQESVIYNFEGDSDGAFPNAVTFDPAGNLIGTTSFRGANIRGTAFSLVPNGQGGWSEVTLYGFSGASGGGAPEAGVIPDGAGGYFGTSSYGDSGNGGTVWQLSPSGGNWLLNTLTNFDYSQQIGFTPPGPGAALTMDAAGNLYGTTVLDGAFDQGSVFKLTHTNGGWTRTTLHDFTGGSDGGQPYSTVSIDAAGNLYGTASVGGNSIGSCYQGLGCGVIWEITP